jgi:hypothetical protein
LNRLNRLIAGQSGNAVTNNSLASLSEGIQQLVQHMRLEQQQIRDWVEAQSESHEDVKKLLKGLMAERERN